MAVDFSVLSADPDLTPHQVLEAVADLLAQMVHDQVLADAVLRGMGAFLSADANTDVTFPTDPVVKVPSIAKLYKAYTDAISTASTVSAAVSADILGKTADTVAAARTVIASDRASALSAVAGSKSDGLAALAASRQAALADLASALTAALQGINDLYTGKVSAFTDIFNVARNTINGLMDSQVAFVTAARTGAETARDVSRAWAESDLEVIPGHRSAKYWAGVAQGVSDVTSVQATVKKLKTKLFLDLNIL